MPGEKHVAALAADANVLLSAVLGHAAFRVFTEYDISVLTTVGVLEDVSEYLPILARQYDMLQQVLEGQLRLLAVRACQRSEYASMLESARRAIAKRDADDVDLLAVALALSIPIWSNDSDFKNTGVRWFTTARLLRHLAGGP